ncbi:MAG: FkbM family methyltransferase [Cytophagaceae bacterium]|jgi:FkbM family methyltransferase|nr:FkbM family methyltransferase [Cytophagaceae bacterium]
MSKLNWKHLGVAIKQFGVIDGIYLFFILCTQKKSHLYVKSWKQWFYIRPHTSDRDAFINILIEQEYKFFTPIIPNNVIDAGANVGYFTKYIKHLYPSSTVICLEPDSSNYSILEQNTKDLDKVFLRKAGLWSNSSMLEVVDRLQVGHWGLSVEENPLGTIKAVGINDIINEFNWTYIDILKIDIEGSEHQLFSKNINWLVKTRIIIIETHERFFPDCNINFENAIQTYIPNHRREVVGENIIIFNLSLM